MSHPVLLHGFTGSSASWGGKIVDGLSGLGVVPVLIDLPGHGRWRGETRTEWFTLDQVLSALARTTGWPADLVGYSMGGRIALHFAAAFPDMVSRLVLESASPGLAKPGQRSDRRMADEQLASRLESEDIESFVEYWEARPLFESRARLGAEALSVQREVRMNNDPRSLAAALRGLGTGSLPSLWDRLSGIRTPTLLMVGELDLKFVEVAEHMASAMPDARLVIVPGAGHTVHVERPDVWVSEVGSFLSGN